MNYKFLSFLIVGVMAGLLFTSCKDDHDDPKEPAALDAIGVLEGDDATANASVKDIRLASVGDYSFGYGSDGKLKSATSPYWKAEVKESQIILTKEDRGEEYGERESFTVIMDISGNRIASFSSKGWYKYKDGYTDRDITYTTDATFTYNAKGQLTSISESVTNKGTLNGEAYNYSLKGSMSFNYGSDHRLLSVGTVENYNEDGYKGTQKTTLTCEYASTPVKNLFYQYSPNMLGGSFEQFDGFFFLGLMGKASSYIPSGYNYVVEDTDYDEPHTEWLSSSVVFNKNGTIRRADDLTYIYTNEGSRAVRVKEITKKAFKIPSLLPYHSHK